jgi:ABC-type molybdate transport system substrate-binding protein
LVVAKYNASGSVQWARTLPDAPNTSEFAAAASDAAGHLYVVGLLYGAGTYTFSREAAVIAPRSTSSVLVKYQE